MNDRLQDPVLVDHAMSILNSAENRIRPPRFQMSLEAALQVAADHEIEVQERLKNIISKRARRAASAPRPLNPLLRMIDEIVALKPSIPTHEVLEKLELLKGFGLVDDITASEILFAGNDGRLRSLKITALRSALSRARKRVRQRSLSKARS